jgi:hypothetical protein
MKLSQGVKPGRFYRPVHPGRRVEAVLKIIIGVAAPGCSDIFRPSRPFAVSRPLPGPGKSPTLR